jgi:hypothetical protein
MRYLPIKVPAHDMPDHEVLTHKVPVYRDLAVAIIASILMKLPKQWSICRDLSL